MPRIVNSILNKQFLRQPFGLPAVGIDRWLQWKIRRSFAMRWPGRSKTLCAPFCLLIRGTSRPRITKSLSW